MKKKIIYTDKAPAPIGPYSQAVQVGQFLFLSGQIALNPETLELVSDSIEKETEQVMENLKAVLESAGATLDDLVSVTVFLKNMSDFPAFNRVYARYVGENPPARATVSVAELPKNVRVEISAVAYMPER